MQCGKINSNSLCVKVLNSRNASCALNWISMFSLHHSLFVEKWRVTVFTAQMSDAINYISC